MIQNNTTKSWSVTPNAYPGTTIIKRLRLVLSCLRWIIWISFQTRLHYYHWFPLTWLRNKSICISLQRIVLFLCCGYSPLFCILHNRLFHHTINLFLHCWPLSWIICLRLRYSHLQSQHFNPPKSNQPREIIGGNM